MSDQRWKTAEGRAELDALYGKGFGTYPAGVYAEGPYIPTERLMIERRLLVIFSAVAPIINAP